MKRNIIYQYLPCDQYMNMQELRKIISKEEEVKFTIQELTQTCNLLRKDGLVEVKERKHKILAKKVEHNIKSRLPAKSRVESVIPPTTTVEQIDTAINALLETTENVIAVLEVTRQEIVNGGDSDEIEDLRSYKEKFETLQKLLK